MHYPRQCRPRVAWQHQRHFAKSLVEADARIPHRFPPSIEVVCTDAAVLYHRRRADILYNILVDVVAAYNIATGGRRQIPRAPPSPLGVLTDDSAEDASPPSEEY